MEQHFVRMLKQNHTMIIVENDNSKKRKELGCGIKQPKKKQLFIE